MKTSVRYWTDLSIEGLNRCRMNRTPLNSGITLPFSHNGNGGSSLPLSSSSARLWRSHSRKPLHTHRLPKYWCCRFNCQGQEAASTDFVNIDQELRIATSPAVAAAANEAVVAKGLTPGDVSISAPSSTNTLVFKAKSTDPRGAQATAQAYAGAYLGFRREALLSNVEAATTSIEEVLAKLNAQLGRVEVQATQANSPSEQQALLLKISALTNQISSQQDLRNQLALSENSPVGESLAHAPLPAFPFKSEPDEGRGDRDLRRPVPRDRTRVPARPTRSTTPGTLRDRGSCRCAAHRLHPQDMRLSRPDWPSQGVAIRTPARRLDRFEHASCTAHRRSMIRPSWLRVPRPAMGRLRSRRTSRSHSLRLATDASSYRPICASPPRKGTSPT